MTPRTVAASLSCPSLSPGVCSNSYPLSQWGHPTISSSVTPFYSCPQSFPASGSFPVSQPPERKPLYGKLTKMITWITGLCNSVKLWAVLCRAIQDRSWWRVLTEHGPLEEGMANHSSILVSRTTWIVQKGEKIWHWKVSSMLLEKSGERASERMKRLSQSGNNIESGGKNKVQCCKEQYCFGTWNVRSMNQGKLNVVKQMARMNKHRHFRNQWTKMDKNGQV